MKYLLTFLMASASTFAVASDWPQWQGPDRNAISKETGLLQDWPESGPPLVWRNENLGGGDSAPAIADGFIYGMSNRDGKEIVWALAERDGKEAWMTSLGAAVEQGAHQSKEGPGGTPTVDGDRLYVIGMGGRVACLKKNDGKVVWQRDLTKDFGGILPMWSYRESPLIDGEQLICTPGGPEATIAALNKMTGETVWKFQAPTAAERPASDRPAPGRSESQNRPGRPGGPPPNAGNTDQSIAGTKDPVLFQSEHWGMTEFTQKVANGKYLVKLYFAETFQGITGAGQRVFSFNVQGTEFKDFDIWEKAGGLRRAYIESVPVEVKNGEIRVTFTRKVENPAIKAIEILPEGDDVKDVKPIRINAGASAPIKDSNSQEWLADQGFADGQTNPGTSQFGGGAPGGRGGRPGGFGGLGGPRSGAAYSSVIAIDAEGQRQYVQLTATSLVGVSATDGKLLWQYNRPANGMGINCSTPIFQDGIVFASSAYGNGGGAVKLTKGADGVFKADEVYFSSNMQNHHGGMIVHDGCLYGANGGNEGGFLTCMDFQTGEILWRDRKAAKGALLMADGRLYLRAEAGTMVLIQPSRDRLIEHGRFEQPDRSGSPAWAHPIVANGKLYVRDQNQLFCYDVKAGN